MPESFAEFFKRRVRELQQSPEWGQLGKMGLTEFMRMMKNDYFDCANDPIPPIAEPDDRAGSMLQ